MVVVGVPVFVIKKNDIGKEKKVRNINGLWFVPGMKQCRFCQMQWTHGPGGFRLCFNRNLLQKKDIITQLIGEYAEGDGRSPFLCIECVKKVDEIERCNKAIQKGEIGRQRKQTLEQEITLACHNFLTPPTRPETELPKVRKNLGFDKDVTPTQPPTYLSPIKSHPSPNKSSTKKKKRKAATPRKTPKKAKKQLLYSEVVEITGTKDAMTQTTQMTQSQMTQTRDRHEKEFDVKVNIRIIISIFMLWGIFI